VSSFEARNQWLGSEPDPPVAPTSDRQPTTRRSTAPRGHNQKEGRKPPFAGWGHSTIQLFLLFAPFPRWGNSRAISDHFKHVDPNTAGLWLLVSRPIFVLGCAEAYTTKVVLTERLVTRIVED
jgi:hypothetical protein